MNSWIKHFRINPIPGLLTASDEALHYFTRRDLMEEAVEPVNSLWSLSPVLRLLHKQLPDGSWPRAGGQQYDAVNVCLIETWRNCRFLIEMYGLTREHPGMEKAAEYIFSCQSPDGDIRGILANQYATYYTGAILSLLIQAGYHEDPRVEHGLQWLLSIRQDDQGWSIPMITHKLDRATQYRLTTEYLPPIEPDRSKPFSHNATGMILRAFAAHPIYRHSPAANLAAELLKSRFFQKDAYTSYQSADYWTRFDYPFWWNHLVSALDSISLIHPSPQDAQMQLAISWFVENQQEDGFWNINHAGKPEKDNLKTTTTRAWITLAICRIFKRLFNE
jgi:hypothetical protein